MCGHRESIIQNPCVVCVRDGTNVITISSIKRGAGLFVYRAGTKLFVYRAGTKLFCLAN